MRFSPDIDPCEADLRMVSVSGCKEAAASTVGFPARRTHFNACTSVISSFAVSGAGESTIERMHGRGS
jgi:hypothetical protein